MRFTSFTGRANRAGLALPGRRREDLSISEVFYVLWSRRVLVLGVVMVLFAVSLLFSLSREPVYTAEVVVSIVPRQQEPSQRETEAFVDEVLAVVADDELLNRVVEETGWRGGVSDFRDRLEPESFVDQGSSGVVVAFSASAPEDASEAANIYSRLFVEKVERLGESRIAGGSLAAEASIESEASPPDYRSSPRPLLYASAAVLVGVLFGGGTALLLESRARSWRDARDAEMTLKAPVIGVIPDYSVLEREET